MSTTVAKTYHKCTVAGEYIKKEAGGKTNDNYEVVVNVPHLGDDKADIHYMSVIKRELLQRTLKAKYPKAITFRTYEMVDREHIIKDGKVVKATENAQTAPSSPTKNVSSMNKTELTDYIQAHELQIDIEKVYTTVDKMRKAIQFYETDKEAFIKEQDEILAEMELKETLADLNPMPQVLNGDVVDVEDDEDSADEDEIEG